MFVLTDHYQIGYAECNQESGGFILLTKAIGTGAMELRRNDNKCCNVVLSTTCNSTSDLMVEFRSLTLVKISRWDPLFRTGLKTSQTIMGAISE